MLDGRRLAGVGDTAKAHRVAAIPAIIPVLLSQGGQSRLFGLSVEGPELLWIILPFRGRRHAVS